MTGNGERDSFKILRIRRTGAEWITRSQASWEQVEGSEIRILSPNAF